MQLWCCCETILRKGRKVPDLPSQDSGVFLAAGKVLGDFRSSALGVPGRNSSGKRLPGAGQALALAGKIPRPASPLRGSTEQAKPNSPSPRRGSQVCCLKQLKQPWTPTK